MKFIKVQSKYYTKLLNLAYVTDIYYLDGEFEIYHKDGTSAKFQVFDDNNQPFDNLDRLLTYIRNL